MRLSRLLLAAPLVAFAALAAVFAFRVSDGADRSVVPSALLGRPAPATTLPPLGAGQPGLSPALFEGNVTLLNVFASWCAPCRVEHPLLMDLAAMPGVQLVGLNYKDRVPAANAFLAELGNPYRAIGSDPDGRVAIEWGVYGVPETFIVGPDGTIHAKHVGPLTPEALAGSFGDTLRTLASPTAGS
ncbi:MAG: DsbE family thiol:disulfide interchange protein [Acuticoccus sp.]